MYVYQIYNYFLFELNSMVLVPKKCGTLRTSGKPLCVQCVFRNCPIHPLAFLQEWFSFISEPLQILLLGHERKVLPNYPQWSQVLAWTGRYGTFFAQCIYIYMAMDNYLLIPFLGGWTSIYQLAWCSPGARDFDPLPYNAIYIYILIPWWMEWYTKLQMEQWPEGLVFWFVVLVGSQEFSECNKGCCLFGCNIILYMLWM